MPESSTTGFDRFFAKLSGGKEWRCWQWQRELADPSSCRNRLVRIPTGFGKTLGVLATWLWHRVHLQIDDWPRRLVWCLPMRVLVEQTESEVRSVLQHLDVLWDGQNDHDDKVGVHLLMGGADAGRWHLYPECDAVLIGTQDMLLSRALNRGYASPAARWPMEFGLLNHDALWVMDEVQLMDTGLATSGQLQVFRNEDQDAGKSMRHCFTWWMSATLQRAWLEKSPDTGGLTEELAWHTHRIGSEERVGHLWDDVTKPLEVISFAKTNILAQDVSQRHRDGDYGRKGPTLVVLNTVERAVEVWEKLRRDKTLAGTDIRLVHSRFRPAERQAWREEFLSRKACSPGTNRIIVSTQVVEAGVDISASLLVTELAPWPSLVQRFGRCARWGGTGKVIVADFDHDSDRKAAPYSVDELEASRDACGALQDVGPIHLERFEEENATLLPNLYPYEPAHLLLRHELNELFDTTPDLSGADIDISRFIRSGDERDVQTFWAEVDTDGPAPSMKPTRNELCSVPFLKARDWLCKPGSKNLKPGVRAWVWDWLNRKWRTATRRDIYPGQTILVEAGAGGYRHDSGWDPKSGERVEPVRMDDNGKYENRDCWKRDGNGWSLDTRRVRVRALPPEDHADAAEEDESLSATSSWQTIASHGLQVGVEVERIAAEVAPDKAALLHLAGRWHDLGKAHPAFQGSMQADDRPERDDIAKAPDIAWPCRPNNMYRVGAADQRRGFRHELASTLGLFGVLQRHEPQHQALLGPWREWFDAMRDTNAGNGPAGTTDDTEPTVIEREILDLGADEFDLLAYLVCAHHGKVRVAWHASPADQKADDCLLRIRGVREGDILPPLPLATADGGFHQLPATALDLSPSEAGLSPRTGRSWTERVLNLVECFGPFTLAWLETLLRSADQRASGQTITDKLLQEREHDNAGHSDGERTGGRGADSETTRPVYSATRYIETSAGILNHQELAPLLDERIAGTEIAISDRRFASLSLQDLLLELHRRICADLTPGMAGRWRLRNVPLGEYQAPPYWQVPILIRSYTADLKARLASLNDSSGEKIADVLAFAEGRLLHIHPLEDFNGRVSRLFLIELLYRLGLPVTDPAVFSAKEAKGYFTALQAYDRHDPRPLSAIWRRRFA